MESLREFFSVIARYSIYLLAGLVPFFVIPVSFLSVPQSKLLLLSVLLGIAVLSWAVSSLAGRSVQIPRHALIYAVLILPLAYIVSAVTAGWPNAALVSGLAQEDTVVTAILFAAACLVTALTLSGRFTHTAVKAIILGGGVLVLFQVARLFFSENLMLGGLLQNSTSTVIGSWHDFGILLGLLVIVCGSFAGTRESESPLWRWACLALATISFVFLVVISMQDVWFVLAGTLALLGVYAWFSGAPSEEGTLPFRQLVQPIVWILLAIGAFLFGWFNVWTHDHLPTPFQIVSVEVRPSWEGTLSVGQNSLATSRTVLFGTGPNTFARNWAQFKPAGVNETLFWNLDFNNGVGVVPTSFVTIGALGVAAWALIVLTFLWSAGVALRREKLFSVAQTSVFGIVCATIFLFIFHIMYAPGIAISLLLFILLGVLVARAPHKMAMISFQSIAIPHVLGVVLVAVVTIGVLFTSAVSVRALVSDVYVNYSVNRYTQNGNVGESSALIQRALSIWPSNDRAHRAAVELGILELAQLGQKASSDEQARTQLEGTLSQTIEHGLKAVSIDKEDYQNWLTLAQLYQELAGVGIEGAYEQAQAAYTTAREENPTNPVPVFRLAQLEVLKGNTSTAIDLFGETIAIKQDFAPAYFLRSQLMAQQNRLDEAIASAAAAVQLIPDDPLGWYNLGVILYAKGDFNQAGAAFAQAVNLRNDYSNAIFMLGLTYYQVGAPEQALAAIMRVRELNPNEPMLATMIQNIQSGQAPFTGLGGTTQ